MYLSTICLLFSAHISPFHEHVCHWIFCMLNSVLGFFTLSSFGICLNHLYAWTFREKGVMQKLVGALRELRCLLSKSEFPPVDAALKAGAIALLVQCLSFGSPDEQVQSCCCCCCCFGSSCNLMNYSHTCYCSALLNY